MNWVPVVLNRSPRRMLGTGGNDELVLSTRLALVREMHALVLTTVSGTGHSADAEAERLRHGRAGMSENDEVLAEVSARFRVTNTVPPKNERTTARASRTQVFDRSAERQRAAREMMMTLLTRARQAICVVSLTACLGSGLACKSGPDDATLSANVKAKVSSAAGPSSNVDVAAKSGVVTLTGTVASDGAKAQTQEVAKGVEGVKEVRNQLTVAPPPAAVDSSQDNALRNAVTANLSKNGVTGVSADARGGVVTLTGSVTRDQLAKAMQAANEASPRPTRVDNQLVIR